MRAPGLESEFMQEPDYLDFLLDIKEVLTEPYFKLPEMNMSGLRLVLLLSGMASPLSSRTTS